MSHMNESCHIWMSHVTYEWIVAHMNESCLIWTCHVSYERFMSRMNGSCTNDLWHVWMSFPMNYSTYEWVTSRIMGHVVYEWFVSHLHREMMGLEGGVSSLGGKGRNYGWGVVKFSGMTKFHWAISDFSPKYLGKRFLLTMSKIHGWQLARMLRRA